MAFNGDNLRPVIEHSATGNRIWFYQSGDDTVADVSANGYFPTTAGLRVNDLILIVASDATTEIKVTSINGTVLATGGQINAEDVLIDESNLPFIGGTVVADDVQGALRRLHQRLNLKVQNVTAVGSGTALFIGTDVSDPSNRRLQFRRLQAGDGIQINLLDDSQTIEISAIGGVGGGINPPGGGSADGGDGTDAAFSSGTRRLHVHPTGGAPLDGTTPDATFTTIQAGLNALTAGDVMTIASGTYRERPTVSNKSGSEALPIWVTAEVRGAVRMADTVANLENGTANWANEGGGVFSTPVGNRPYFAYHADSGDFLFPYLNENDLRATTITAFSNIFGRNTTITKPPYGMAFEAGRMYVRLRNNQNPNGQSIVASATIARGTLAVNNCDNFIIDGINFEGAGNTSCLTCDNNCTNITIRNCRFSLVRHGIRNPSDTLIETCTYEYVGFGNWGRDLFELDGPDENGVFSLCKGYYNAANVSNAGTPVGGGGGNALLEGSIDFGDNINPPATNVVIDNCLIGPCFDGSRLGTLNESVIRNTVFLECRDDGVQNEGPTGHPATDNEIHDCKFINCYHDISVQGDLNVGDFFVYRCVIQWDDPALAIPDNYSLKMIKSSEASENFFYHCTFYIDYGQNTGGPQRLWTAFGGDESDADKIELFQNNVIVVPRELSQGAGGQPEAADIRSNAVVGPSAGVSAFLTGNGGVFAGTDEDDMKLNADFSLQATSPARNRGTALPNGFPDSRNSNADCGAFPFGESNGENWPRPATIVYNLDPPSRWPLA